MLWTMVTNPTAAYRSAALIEDDRPGVLLGQPPLDLPHQLLAPLATYVYYRDERHGLGRPENRCPFKAVVEAFLAAHLGGRCEPVGEDFGGSTIEFKAGRELIPGLD
jgi:hypothetical protein